MINPITSGLAVSGYGGLLFPYYDIGPRGRAPRLALVADLHGQDLNGLFVLSRLAAFLRSIRLGERRALRLRERIVIVPTINCLESLDPRKLPQRAGGQRRSLWSVIVEALLALTRAAYYRVNIHQVSLDVEEIPQIRLYSPSDDERATACLFGLPAVIERPMEHEAASGLTHAWREQGGENFSIYAGQSGSVQTQHCETVFRSLVAFLDRTGIISGLKSTDEEELGYFGLRQIVVVSAAQPGIFASPLEVGRWVREGEELGQIYDSFSGKAREPVVAPVSGLLASLRRQPLLGKGELLARILLPDAACREARACFA
ncbi:MAG: succinylglutamate desuccinylase [Candidatus Competibacteraceae bacterium]|nr:succinylglutamate desuccinylase [Candidatus Competibacteraceae bacterium]